MAETLSCPSCREQNPPDMAFCIFCGESMKNAASRGNLQAVPDTSAPAPVAQAARSAKTCPSCNVTDPLNETFCVQCGTKIPDFAQSAPTSGAQRLADLKQLREDIASVQQPPRGMQRRQGGNGGTILGLFLVALAGLAVGATAGFFALPKGENAVQLDLPKQGLTILTAKPFCDFLIELPNHRNFLLGRTGSEGDVSLPDIAPGNYQISLTAKDGTNFKTSAGVQGSYPCVLGGPPGPKLLATESPKAN